MHRTTTGRELIGVLAVLVAACALLASPTLSATGEFGVLAGVVGLALWSWCRSRGDVATLRAIASPPTAIRARRRAAGRTSVPRQADPDAPGRPRPRAPGRVAVVRSAL
ncbi:DUF6412 domain-containing protein [Pseudonocardia sp. KRD291]|uniref:DUF6412 domain-containing protein n=1 Tax=Pseudonocardia sp. KRD291 TaxID=2792007 RepID=UPI001C49E075|nr:DUF6412 domain-containing protein [Pseudonocardia sp. KRD291]MBW0106456.1 hypothetical protein [Pseudonocardia sp. KRD291]